jgi:hypothetical protein
VETRKPITEDDVLLTELLLAQSFGNLKKSVVKTSFAALGSVGGTVRKHPFATAGVAAGAAAGAGLLLFMLVRKMRGGGSSRRGADAGRERTSRPDMAMDLLSMLMPVITPYITAYVEKYLGREFSRGRT